jgi:hypothetical protein
VARRTSAPLRHSVDFGFPVTFMTPAISRPHVIVRVFAETIAA